MEEQLALLIAEREINRLLQRYCHCMDLGDEAGWVDCFTDTALFDVRNYKGEIVHIENGRADLERYIARYPKPPHMRRHLYTSAVLDIDAAAGTATGESYWTLMGSGENGEAVLMAFGRARDRYVRTDAWRIDERIAVADAV